MSLRQSLTSVFRQKLPPTEVVLLKDGPLTEELDKVIAEYVMRYPELKIVSLPVNQGLGKALNEGLKHCSYDLVARMDTDDIAKPDRFEKQIRVFQEHPELDVVGAWIDEFEETTSNIISTRKLPEVHDDICQFAKKRNPFNHPCVMYKKSAVEAVGSYQDFYLLEDYYLWLRMLMAGYQGYNIQEPLLHMRAGSDMYLRRAGWKYAKTQARLFKFMKSQGFIGKGQYIKSCVIRSGSALAPNWLRKFMFEKVLRK